MRSLAIRLMPTSSPIASAITPIASISPATVSDADAPDQSHRIDHQPATLPKNLLSAERPPTRRHHLVSPGDIVSESAGDIVGTCNLLYRLEMESRCAMMSRHFPTEHLRPTHQ